MATYNFLREAEVYLQPTFNVASGLTVSETHEATIEIDGLDGTAFGGTPRSQKVFMAGEVVLPSSFSNNIECLFEHGGSGQGTWIGITTDNGVKNFHFRTGNGSTGESSQVQGTTRIYQKIPISEIPEFDGQQHTVAWELDPVGNTAKFWIDNRLVISESASGLAEWSGGDDGGWLKGYDSIAGFGTGESATPYKTQWSGAAGSALRVYSNQARTYSNEMVKLEVTPEVSFGQTFTDSTTQVRTLHSEDFFEKSNIKKANPANFEFTIPVFKEDDIEVVHNRLLDCSTFDLYISTKQDVFKLEKAVISNGTYGIERSTPLTLTVSGQASKLSKLGSRSSLTSLFSIVQSSTTNRTYLRTSEVTNTLNSVDISSETVSINAELQNEIQWTPYTTVQGGMAATSRSNVQYPENFSIGKKIFSGSIVRYLCDTNNNLVNDFDEDSPLRIKVGQTIAGTFYGFDFNMPSCSFTNRSAVGEIFTQSYDWRLTDNSQPISTTITYNNI